MLRLLGVEDDERIAADQQSPQPFVDLHAMRQMNEQLRDYDDQIARAQRECDQVSVDVLQAEQQQLLESVKAATNIRGQPRDLNNPIEKWRPRIAGRLGTAYSKLRDEGMPKLADHFQRHIKAESASFTYDPGPDAPAWQTDSE